jgi:hypothetical protein
MTAITERQYPGEFLHAECPGSISRETVTVTVPGATTLAPGTVLGQISASGKYVEYDNAASDGSEVAVGVLYSEQVNDAVGAADQSGVVIDFGAEVRSADLTWKTGLSAGDQTAGIADLKTRFIKVRT